MSWIVSPWIVSPSRTVVPVVPSSSGPTVPDQPSPMTNASSPRRNRVPAAPPGRSNVPSTPGASSRTVTRSTPSTTVTRRRPSVLARSASSTPASWLLVPATTVPLPAASDPVSPDASVPDEGAPDDEAAAVVGAAPSDSIDRSAEPAMSSVAPMASRWASNWSTVARSPSRVVCTSWSQSGAATRPTATSPTPVGRPGYRSTSWVQDARAASAGTRAVARTTRARVRRAGPVAWPGGRPVPPERMGGVSMVDPLWRRTFMSVRRPGW